MTEDQKSSAIISLSLQMRSIHTAIDGRMRRSRYFALSLAALLTLWLAGCGGSSTSAPSGITKRVFVSNETGSLNITPPTGVGIPAGLQIVNANNDTLSTTTIGAPGAAKTITAGGFTVVLDFGQNSVSIVDNSKESVTQTFGTPNLVTDVALTSNGATAYASISTIGVLDSIITSSGSGTGLNLPSVSRLVMSPNGTKLLAFVNNPNAQPFNTGGFFIVDTASNGVTPVTDPSLDQPFSAVFNGSETKAFILNCGPECGGTTASVVPIDFSGATPVFGTKITLQAATVGLLSGSTLFVAGTSPPPPVGTGTGVLQVINTGSSSISGSFTITDGLHQKMVMASNNRLYIGAAACTTVNDVATGMTRGCLTIFNTSNSALVFPEFNPLRNAFDVTGIQPISNRTVVYVAEGGKLDIFDTNTDQLTFNQVVIFGKAIDVVQVDP